MSKYTVILVDDERLSREELRRYLQDYPAFRIIAEAADADEAETIIREHHPDLVLLDIQMPGRSGFELLESLDQLPEIIFVTAFNEYAVKAFETQAVDYLVKPVREERFAKSMERIQQILGQRKQHAGHTIPQSFFVKEGERFHIVKVEEIYRISSSGNYAKLYFGTNTVLIRRSLNQLEKTLDHTLFFRINRNDIINTAFLQKVSALPGGRMQVLMRSGDVLIVSGRQSALFKNKNVIQ